MSSMRRRPILSFALIVAVLTALVVLFPAGSVQAQSTSLYFPETGYSIRNDAIRNYFQTRGGINTFGYPVSRTFLFRGFPVQVFQRHVLQVIDGQARPVNLLDPLFLPITHFGGLTFPAYDPEIAAQAPGPSTPGYASAVQQHLQQTVPTTWNGVPVNFYNYYLSSAPSGSGGAAVLTALEVWGFPTSAPRRDPNNGNFIYQRFQRGIMHYDATQNVTRGILLGDAFKSVLRGQNISAAMRAELEGSALLGLYAPDQPNALAFTAPALNPPITRENTDLTGAFDVEPVQATFTSARVYLVDTDTQSEGCGVNVVPWTVQFEPTSAPLTAALQALVMLGQTPNRSDLYNAAYVTHNIRLESVTIRDGTATIHFSGTYHASRPCDLQWFRVQVRQTALQYDTVQRVNIYIGGRLVEDLLADTTPSSPQPPTFDRVNIYLISLESGGPIGCNDSVVAVERRLDEPTTMPLTMALRELLSIKERTYGQSGLYNALYRTDLHIQEISLNNGHAVIRLQGEYQIGGTCDEPRVTAQLRETVLQFNTVNSAEIYINGQRIE